MNLQIRLADGWALSRIAAEMGVATSTLSREVRRAVDPRGRYVAGRAQRLAEQRALRPRPGKLETNGELRRAVVARLAQWDSPEQVAHQLRVEFPDRDDMHVSHETIYQALYVQAKGSLREEVEQELARRAGDAVTVRVSRTSRKPRSRLDGRRTRKSWIGPDAHITDRPPEAADRAIPGHWEGDLVVGKGHRSGLVTLAERSTRYVLIGRIESLDTRTVTDALLAMMADLPATLARTLTWDQGTEMADHHRFSVSTDCKVHFCDPHSPWQRGTNENTYW